MNLLKLQKIRIKSSSVELPASKSISNRLLILNAVCGNRTEILNLSEADDTQLLKNVLEQLNSDKKKYTFHLNNAGTTIRFLTAYLSNRRGNYEIQCSQRMKKRPIGDLVDALRNLDAEISYLDVENFPPLFIKGKKLTSKNITVSLEKSSQFASAILMIAATFDDNFSITLPDCKHSFSYFEMTLKIMQRFGVECLTSGRTFVVKNEKITPPKSFLVESDWSAAAVWYAFVSLQKNVELKLPNLYADSVQGDWKLVEIYEKLGVKTVFAQNGITISQNGIGLPDFVEIDLRNNPDLMPTIAVNLCLLDVKFKLTGLENLKIKESDRILAIISNLNRVGYTLYAKNGVLEWTGQRLQTPDTDFVKLDSFDDHRIVMACSLLATQKNIEIINPNCVSKSYPNFFEILFNNTSVN